MCERCGIFFSGTEKIRIRNKYPGSTTLVGLISDFVRTSYSKLAKNVDPATATQNITSQVFA
jgi:hypothetical protein